MIIACDGDGITCDLHPEWLRRYNRDYNDTLTVEQWLSWDAHKYVKPECGKDIYKYLRDPDLYENIVPVAGAVEGVVRLRALGHQIIFVTANTYGMTDQKARWFERWGFCEPKGHDLPHDFVPMFNKNNLDAYLLIDDGAHNVRRWVEEKARPAIMLERPYNMSLLNEVPSAFWMKCHRAKTWSDIVRHVERMSVLVTV